MQDSNTKKEQNSQAEMTRRPRPIFNNDIQRLGGTVSVVPSRDPVHGGQNFRIQHISRGGDVCWLSPVALPDEDRAIGAAEVLAAFTGAEVRR
jgi:hypothetical protein